MRHTRKNKKQKKLPVQIPEKSEFEKAMNRLGFTRLTNTNINKTKEVQS